MAKSNGAIVDQSPEGTESTDNFGYWLSASLVSGIVTAVIILVAVLLLMLLTWLRDSNTHSYLYPVGVIVIVVEVIILVAVVLLVLVNWIAASPVAVIVIAVIILGAFLLLVHFVSIIHPPVTLTVIAVIILVAFTRLICIMRKRKIGRVQNQSPEGTESTDNFGYWFSASMVSGIAIVVIILVAVLLPMILTRIQYQLPDSQSHYWDPYFDPVASIVIDVIILVAVVLLVLFIWIAASPVAVIVIAVIIFVAVVLLVILSWKAPSPVPVTAIAVIILAAVVLLICIMCYLPWKKRKIGRVQNPVNGKEVVKNIDGSNVVISIEVLRQVTNNFSEDNILGRGGFGVVYKGEFSDGTKIAVKRMKSGAMSSKGMEQFQAEIEVLTKVRHRHLVALLGYCTNDDERLLVFEYMPEGTLTQHLFHWGENGCSPLTWKQRITIALDVARGVEYLHRLAQQSFIHRDLKPSNILLRHDMRAKVADFGLVKNVSDGTHSVETQLAGTFGYLAPEYAATGRVTAKVDVYAFGVVLMELITGRKAINDTMPDEWSHLVTWFCQILINKENIMNAIDQTLKPDEETLENIIKVVELAKYCTTREPYQRPDIGHVVNILSPLVEQWEPTCHEEEHTHSIFHGEEDTYGTNPHMSLSLTLER